MDRRCGCADTGAMRQSFYKDTVAPILARWVLRFFTRRHKIMGAGVTDSKRTEDSGVDSIDDLTSEQLRQYLLRIPGEDEELEAHVTSRLAPDSVAMLNLGHDWLRSFLPHCLSKINRVSFGLLSALQVSDACGEGGRRCADDQSACGDACRLRTRARVRPRAVP